MPVQQILSDNRWPVLIWTDECDDKSKQQLSNVAQLAFINHHVAAMPDVHVGKGATIGSVIATTQAIIPAAVGVDLGCGMIAARLSLSANELDEASILKVYNQIHRDVPVGRDQHQPDRALSNAALPFADQLKIITDKHPELRKSAFRNFDNWIYQMGTLGSGNHFIEICLDEAHQVWVMLHSGSRGIGNAIGNYFIERAKKDLQQWDVHLPDADLAYLPEGSTNFDDYIEAIDWAQRYAYQNRQAMLNLVLAGMRKHVPAFTVTQEVVNCHHNYVAKERHFGVDSWVTRKGAIRAGLGELGIIPGSMGAKSYIVKGKGNPDAFCSCAHGAGRKMSRTEARQSFTVEDLKQQTAGVQCKKDNSVLDEIPGAYKDIDKVMSNQTDLVEVVHTLKQVITIKG